MMLPVLMMTQPVGTPYEIFSTRPQSAPNLKHVANNIIRMQVFYEGGADRPIKRRLGKVQLDSGHREKLYFSRLLFGQ